MLLSRASARTIYLIKRVETMVKAELETELREFALTPGQYTTMSLLKANSEISSAALARRITVSPQSMSETITALEKKGPAGAPRKAGQSARSWNRTFRSRDAVT